MMSYQWEWNPTVVISKNCAFVWNPSIMSIKWKYSPKIPVLVHLTYLWSLFNTHLTDPSLELMVDPRMVSFLVNLDDPSVLPSSLYDCFPFSMGIDDTLDPILRLPISYSWDCLIWFSPYFGIPLKSARIGFLFSFFFFCLVHQILLIHLIYPSLPSL